MYESSVSEFFRTTFRIQSGADAFEEPGCLLSFQSTELGVTKLSCIFRLALEGIAGKEIPESSR